MSTGVWTSSGRLVEPVTIGMLLHRNSDDPRRCSRMGILGQLCTHTFGHPSVGEVPVVNPGEPIGPRLGPPPSPLEAARERAIPSRFRPSSPGLTGTLAANCAPTIAGLVAGCSAVLLLQQNANTTYRGDPWQWVTSAMTASPVQFIDVVDWCLHRTSDIEDAAVLEVILSQGSSVWKVTRLGDVFELQNRIDSTVEIAARTSATPRSAAAHHLAESWSYVYGENQNPTAGY